MLAPLETPTMDHNQVLVHPSPAGLATAPAAAGTGTIPCAGCAGTAGDYLAPPDLSTPCCRCGGGLPLCRRCAAISAGGGAGGGAEEMNLEEAIMCTACARFVCAEPGCSTRCSDMECEVGMGVFVVACVFVVGKRDHVTALPCSEGAVVLVCCNLGSTAPPSKATLVHMINLLGNF